MILCELTLDQILLKKNNNFTTQIKLIFYCVKYFESIEWYDYILYIILMIIDLFKRVRFVRVLL